MLAAFYLLFREHNKEKADLFFEQYRTGENLSAGNPILALREMLAKNQRVKTGNLSGAQLGALFVSAWNFFIQDKQAKTLTPVLSRLAKSGDEKRTPTIEDENGKNIQRDLVLKFIPAKYITSQEEEVYEATPVDLKTITVDKVISNSSVKNS